MKKEETKSSSIFFIFGLFIFGFILFIISVIYFFKGTHIYGVIFLVLAIALNITIFIKGRKIAVIFGVLFLIFILFVSVAVAIYGFGLTKEITEEEKIQILEEKKELIDNLFEGYESGDYEKYSRDLDDSMKEKHDKIELMQLREMFGKIISRDCSDALKSTIGGPVILCNVEFENAKTIWDIRFNTWDSKIWGLYFEVINPEIELIINKKEIVNEISATFNNNEVIFKSGDEEVYLIFDVIIKNNQEEEVVIHGFTFETGKYFFEQLIFEEEYVLECNNLVSETLAPNQEKQGCIMFEVVEGYTDGEIKIE